MSTSVFTFSSKPKTLEEFKALPESAMRLMRQSHQYSHRHLSGFQVINGFFQLVVNFFNYLNIRVVGGTKLLTILGAELVGTVAAP